MYTIIGMRDMTAFVAPDNEDNGSAQSAGISFSSNLNDPATTWNFVIDDIAQTLNVQNFMPVIVFDETQPAIGSVSTVPSMNFARTPDLITNNTSVPNWTASGSLSSLWIYTQVFPKVLFSNDALGSALLQQTTLRGYVQSGVEYMFSAYITGIGTIQNIQALLQITFQDINGNTLGSPITGTWTPGTETRVNITGVAPVNAAYVQIAFGGQTTVAGINSGEIQFGVAQFEPMWFTSQGVSYPTPDCTFSQVNCVQMPDGTTSRKCRLFAGYVEDHINYYVGKQRHTAVQCASSSKLLETAGLVNASFTSTQDTTIITNAIGQLAINTSILNQLSTGQQNEFSPTSTLIPGVIVDSINFTDSTMREVANGVSAQSSSLFYVDPYYYLWYVPPSFVGNVVELSDTPDNITSFAYDTFSVEYDSTNPVNYVRVKGTKQKAAAITDSFTGDGATTVFDLTEPPDTITSVTVAGSSVRAGVDGVDNSKFGASSTYKALINKQKQTIQFATAPGNGAAISATYTFEDQVISDVLAADAIASQQAQFWSLISDSNITSTTAAKHRGLTELQDYGEPRIILTLSSLDIYIPVGGLILFTCQSESMSQTPFVVQTVDADPQAGGVYHWNYTAGVYNPTIIDHIRNVQKAVKKTPTTANVAVVASIDVALFDEIHINDSVVINANGAPPQGPYLYGSALYGYASYS